MTAIEYGKENFGDFSLNDITNNIYVFDDTKEYDETNNSIQEPISYFLECIENPIQNGTYIVNPLEEKIPDYVFNYALSTNVIPIQNLGKFKVLYNQIWYEKINVYEIEGKFYSNIEKKYIDEVEIKPKFQPKIKKPAVGIITDLLKEKRLSVVVFISTDGALLNTAYLTIDKVFENEIIFFVERKQSEKYADMFGTIIRVKSGNNIGPTTPFPTTQVNQVFQIFKLDITKEIVQNIFNNHINERDSVLYGVKKFWSKKNRLVLIPTTIQLKLISGTCTSIASVLKSFKLADHHWQYYNSNGQPLEKIDLLLPGINLFENNNTIDQSAYKGAVKDSIEILQKIRSKVQELVQNNLEIKYIFEWIPNLIDYSIDFITNPLDTFKPIGKQAFIYNNALLVGIINGIIEAIAGLLDLISLLIDVILKFFSAGAAASENLSVVNSLFFEIIENIYEAFLNLFTQKNLHAIIQFFKDAFQYGSNLPTFIYSWIQNNDIDVPIITIDRLGYYIGYIIGIIIELVAEIFATGGVATIGEAFSQLGTQLTQIFNGTKKLVKTSIRTLEVSVEKILALFKYISEKSKNLGKFFEDFWKWIEELFEKGKQVVDNVKDFLVRQYKISKATLELLEDLGVTIIRNIDDKLRHSPVLVTPEGFKVLYENKTLFEGTGDDIKRFVDKIEDINKNSGSKGCKKYIEKLRLLKTNIQGYIENRKKLKEYNSEALLSLFKEAVTVKELDAVAYYEKMIKKFPKLKGEFDFEGKFRQVNFAEFSIKKGNKGVFEKEIKELYHSGEEHIYDEFINPFEDELTSQQFQKGVVDIKGSSRRNDSEAKFIYNFLKEHLHTADEFIIETKNIYFTCTSCQREIVMLKNYAEKLGRKIEIIVHGDKNILGGDDLYKAMKNK